MSNQALHVHVRVERSRRGREGFVLDVDFRVSPGITILFGPSGSGKTTILQAIAGLLRPRSGTIALGNDVWFDADEKRDTPTRDRHVAYVFQSLALFPHMTALANAAYGVAREIPRAERTQRAHDLLVRLGVGHLAERKPHTFSGGEAQRVALARALAMAPKLMLLDEPFSALDDSLRRQLINVVRELVDEYQLPLIHVTHHREEARVIGDSFVRVQDGRITAQGSFDDVLGPELSETSRSPRLAVP